MYVLCAYRESWAPGLRQLERFLEQYYLQQFTVNLVDYLNTHTKGKKGEEKEETDELFLEEKCKQDVEQKYPSSHKTILKFSQQWKSLN